MINELIKETDQKITKSIDTFKTECSKISINKANINLLNNIKINYYKEIYTLKQISIMTIEDGNSVVIKPFDKKNIPVIAKEIVDLKLDLNPFVNGNAIKVIFPKMTLERRQLFVKKIKEFSEEIKISIRNIRRNQITKIKTLIKDKKISEDEEKIILTKIENIVQKSIEKVEETMNKKVTELLKI